MKPLLKLTASALACLALSTHANLPQASSGPIQFEVTQEVIAGQPQEFENPLFFDVGASCRIETSAPQVNFKVDIISGGGKVNGKRYGAGTTLDPYPARNNDRFELMVEGNAKARLELKSEPGVKKIIAHCSVKL